MLSSVPGAAIGRSPMFELTPYEKFLDTPAVRFFDITVAPSFRKDVTPFTRKPGGLRP